MNLYIKQKVFSLGDKYTIMDENGETVFSVEGEIFTFGAKLHMFDAAGREVMLICRELLTWMPRYLVYENGVERACVQKRFALFETHFEVSDRQGIFNVDGDFFALDYSITSPNGDLLGSIHKKWLSWGDSYELTVTDPAHAAFFCALVIAIDECIHNENNN